MLKSDEELLSELDDLRAEVERLRDLRFVMVAERDAEIERLRTALLEIASPTKWSAITPDSDGAITGMLIVSEMQRVARDALTGGKRADDATSVYGAECDPRTALTGGKE